MSLISKVRGANKDVVITHNIHPGTYQKQDFWFFHSDGTDYKIEFSGHNSSLKAFTHCPPLSAVIHKKSLAYINGKTWILNKKGKAKDKEATGEVATMVRNLLENPNPFQTQSEFEAQLFAYTQIWGWSIVVFMGGPVGFADRFLKSKKMWNIPPCMVDVERTRKNWLMAETNKDLVKKIIIRFGEEEGEIPLDACYIFKDLTISLGIPLFPESRVTYIQQPVNNIIGAYESRGKLIDYRGALGIISPDSRDGIGMSLPMSEEHKLDLQKEALQYGIRRGQFNFIISNAAVKWNAIGIPTKDLMLFEEVEDNAIAICEQYGYPARLFNYVKVSSLGGSDVRFFQTMLYQDTIIPEAEHFGRQWDKVFGLSKYDLIINKDYSHLPALQEDEQKKAGARKTRNEAYQIEFYNNLCTLDQWRVANGEDPLQGDFGGKFYYQLLNEGWKFGNGPAITINAGQQETNQQQTETQP